MGSKGVALNLVQLLVRDVINISETTGMFTNNCFSDLQSGQKNQKCPVRLSYVDKSFLLMRMDTIQLK